MRIGVLAVQGAFLEHENMLHSLGVECFEIRQKADLLKPMDGLVLPGGESTVMGKLLRELDLFDGLKEKIQSGLPVLGTCAGLILLAERLLNEEKVSPSGRSQAQASSNAGLHDKTHFATLPVTVKRNAYGRQLGSFYVEADLKGVGHIPMTFIRAPYVVSAREDVEILAEVEDRIVAVRYQNQIGLAFHPEVTADTKLHAYFLDVCEEACFS